MDRQRRQHWSPQGIIFVILFSISLIAISCGSPSEDRQKKNEFERKELILKNKAKVKEITDQLAKKHNFIYFPPETLIEPPFTYELQKFFDKYAGQKVLFRGYLEDIQKTDRSIVVEFLCPIGKSFFISKTAIRFLLTISEKEVVQLLEAKRENQMFRKFRYFKEPDYLIIAMINDLKRTRTYEFSAAAQGEEIEIDIPPSFVSSGVLIEAIIIPK